MPTGASGGAQPAPVLPSARAAAVRLEAVGPSARAARSFVRTHLGESDQETLDTALLVVTELVTNAVLHARGPIDVTLAITDDALLVRVFDCDPRPPVHRPVTLESTDGRGVALVAMVSEQWGAISHDEGKTVWSLITRPV